MQPVAVFPGVYDVQDVTRLTFEPSRFTIAFARDDTKTRRHIGMEIEAALAVLAQEFDIVKERQIVEHRIVFTEPHIVWRPWPGKLNINRAQQLSIRAGNTVAHIRWFIAVVKEVKLARPRVNLGVSRYRVCELPVESLLAASIQVKRIDLIRVACHVPQRQQVSVVENDVRIRVVFDRRPRQQEVIRPGQARPDGFARDLLGYKRARAHPPLSERCATIPEIDSPHHRIAIVVVILRIDRLKALRRAVHDVRTTKVRGQVTLNLKLFS